MEDEARKIIVESREHALALAMQTNQERGMAYLDHNTWVVGEDKTYYYVDTVGGPWYYRVGKYTGIVEDSTQAHFDRRR